MAKRKKKQAKKSFERIQPTEQRIAHGDLEIGEDQVFRSVRPSVIEQWAMSGFLGKGRLATERYEALQYLMELSESAQLMASNTSQFDRVGDRTTSVESPDICALDLVRKFLKNVPPRYRSMLMNLCCCPDRPLMVDVIELHAASDCLIDVIEKGVKKNS